MILKAKDQLERLHQLIESGSTGSPAELAQRLGVTDRTVRNYISQLVKLGAPVEYSRSSQTYYYKHPVALRFTFEPLNTSAQETSGGGVTAFLLAG
ncbi:helix-turn-helix domain-containing protein [Perlabentimonas gracilis]|uniref:helix-turn-helix domain-containing protein n=1 Tax=Perlabentimonas gracilis TaxID=2715279 RepID=UPI00140B1BD5|nr:helix-turn-helix domain-containing protein [Perlabentimonas gracilis]NHB69307.1 helix-turn-helix domain-containing protein [Perlabentimonas gracilis]